MNNKNLIIGVIVIVFLTLGGWFIWNGTNTQNTPSVTKNNNQKIENQTPSQVTQNTANTQAPVTKNTNSPTNQTPNQQVTQTPSQNNPSPSSNSGTGVVVEVKVPATNTVTYTNSGYSPSTLTIKNGDTVNFKNESSHGMWTASGMHPSHTVYSGTSLSQHCPDSSATAFDECQEAQPGQSWSFTFTKTGTWMYHNHSKSSDFGKIIVE